MFDNVTKTNINIGLRKKFTFVSNADSLDWKKLSVDEMYNRVTSKVQNGSIILFHNGVENTPDALDKILTKLKTDGYEFVAVGGF